MRRLGVARDKLLPNDFAGQATSGGRAHGSERQVSIESQSLRRSLAALYRFMAPARRRQLGLLLVLMIAGGAAELLSIGAMIPFLGLLAGGAGSPRVPFLSNLFSLIGAISYDEQLVVAALLFIMAAVSAAAIRLLLTWTTQSFALQLGHELSIEVQRRVLQQPYSYHLQRNSSEIIASLDKVQNLVFSFVLPMVQIAAAAVISTFILTALAQVNLVILVVAIFSLAAIYGVWVTRVRNRMQHYSDIAGSDYDRRVQIVQENLGGIRDIILDHSHGAHLKSFAAVDRRLAGARARAAFLAAAPRFVVEAFGMVLIAALAVMVARREEGLATALPMLGAFVFGAQRLLPLVQQLYHGWSSFAMNRSIVGQVLAYLHLPIEADELADDIEPLPFRQAIELKEVSFHHAGRRRPAIQDLSLIIPKGSRVALIGPTGSGKSSLADLLMGLLEPAAGEILVDDVMLTRESRRAWRRCIAHVPQHLFLADTTITRNIAFGRSEEEVDIDRVRDAARVAQLAEFIASLPDGYDTRVGERGMQLSGGQRQRLAIARAVYKRAPVLVLDEATNALDPATEEAVIAAVGQLGERGRTIIMIAHRMSVVRHCDLIVRLENGRIVEVGSASQVFGEVPGAAC